MNPMTMMNNPMMQMLSMMQAGRNPMQVLAAIAKNNPQAQQMMNMIQGKTPDQLRKMAENMAAERGTTIEDVARQLGIAIPSNR